MKPQIYIRNCKQQNRKEPCATQSNFVGIQPELTGVIMRSFADDCDKPDCGCVHIHLRAALLT